MAWGGQKPQNRRSPLWEAGVWCRDGRRPRWCFGVPVVRRRSGGADPQEGFRGPQEHQARMPLKLGIPGQRGSALLGQAAAPLLGNRGHTRTAQTAPGWLDIRKKSFTVRVIKCWNQLPGEVVDVLSLSVFSWHLDSTLSVHTLTFVYLEVVRHLNSLAFAGPFISNCFNLALA